MQNILKGLIVLYVVFFISSFAKAQIPESRKKTTVATVEEADIARRYGGSFTSYSYVVNGIKYFAEIHILPGVAWGEKCTIEYDSLNPSDYDLHRELPVFLPDEETKFTIGTLANAHKNYEAFGFYYSVIMDNGTTKKFERCQSLGLGNPVKNHPQLVNGATFVIEYWVNNPQRAILYIDRPVKGIFLPNEKTYFVVGTIVKTHENKKEFTFIFNTVMNEFKVSQLLPNGDEVKNYPQLVNGAKFVVEFSPTNPSRALLYLNRPVNISKRYPVYDWHELYTDSTSVISK